MADVVVRSASEQSELAGKLGGAIADAGFDVWRADGPDDDFWHSGEVVERIRSANAAVLIWSEGAAASALICDEANAARQQSKLIQVSADGRTPPAPFDQAPVAQLSDWRGEPGHPGWRQVISQLEAMSPSRGGAKAKRQIARAFRSFPLPSLVLPRRLRADAMLALPSPYNPAGARNRRRFQPTTFLFLVALTGAAGAAGWVGGRQQGIREGAEMAATAPADTGRTLFASARAADLPKPPAAATSRPSSPPAPARPIAAAAAPAQASAEAPGERGAQTASAEGLRRTNLAATSRSEKSESIARERKSTAKAKTRARSKMASKSKPAPKPAQPRIKYRYSETMRLFCQRAGKATPECRIFRRNAPRRRR